MMGGQPNCGGCDPHGQRQDRLGRRNECALEGGRGNRKSHGGAHSAYTLGCCGKIWHCEPPAARIACNVFLLVGIDELGGK